MAPIAQRLQPASRSRLLPPGITGLHLPAMLEDAGLSMKGPDGESRTAALLRLGRPLLDPPGKMVFAWHYLDGIECLWLAGGNLQEVNAKTITGTFRLPVFTSDSSHFAGEEGGLAMLEELECRGMVCDLGQTIFKVSWAGQRWAFPRDLSTMPHHRGKGLHTIEEKGAQRRVLRRFIAESLRAVASEAADGEPEGVVFALPSAMDKWGQPAGSSYIGMSMDTQLVTDALELAGLPGIPHWLLNDAELAATSAIFDERVIACGGKALVFTLGTAIGCAVADPLAAALHFARETP